MMTLKKGNLHGLPSILIILTFVLLGVNASSFAFEIKQPIADALAAGDTAKAIDLIEADIKLDPGYEVNYYLLGKIAEKRHKYGKALEYYQTAVDKKSKFYEGLYALGLMQLELGQLDQAEATMKTGLKKARDMEAWFHNGMGLVQMAKGNLNDADKEIRQALIADPDNARFHINLGDVNFANKVYPLAISEYEKALQLDTASTDVYFRWAEACLEMRDYTCALEKLRVVLTKDSTFADAWMKAGGIYYKAARSTRDPQEIKQRFIETIGSYERYIELSRAEPDSFSGRAYYETAMSYLFIGGYDKSQDYFRKVISIPVEPKDIYFYFARSFQGSENPLYDSALFYYKKHDDWVKAQGEDYVSGVDQAELYRRMGECYQAQKDYYNTISYFKKSLELDPNQPNLLYGAAVAYNYIQDYNNALIYYKKRIDAGMDERYWSIYYNAATCALYLVEKGGAAMMEEEDLGLEEELGGDAKANPLEGIDLSDLAIQYLEKIAVDHWSVVQSKENYMATGIKALGMLGSTYLYQKKDCANGVKWYQKVLEYDSKNCDALKSLGYAYFSGICTNNYTKALEYLGKAKSCMEANGTDQCGTQLVDLQLWIGQAHQFRAIERNDAKQKEEAKADFKAAYDYYTAILKCDPGNKAATEGKEQVYYEF